MNLKEMHSTKKNEQQPPREDEKQLKEYIEALEIAQAEREAESQSRMILQDENRELQDRLFQMNLQKESEEQEKLLLKAENSNLKKLNEELTKQLTEVNNSKQILKEIKEKQEQNEDREKKLNERESRLKSESEEQATKDKSLFEREKRVKDTEEAVKKESERQRAEEQEEHRKKLADLEQERAEISKEKDKARESIARQVTSRYIAFKYGLIGYITVLTVALFSLSVLSISQQKTFNNDFFNFFTGVPSLTIAGADKIRVFIPIQGVAVRYVVLAILFVIVLAVLYLLFLGAKENTGMIYLSSMALLLAVFVFLGEKIKPMIQGFNLFGAWLSVFIGTLTVWNIFVKVREMRNGVIQDSTKNIIFFIGITLLAIFLFVMVW